MKKKYFFIIAIIVIAIGIYIINTQDFRLDLIDDEYDVKQFHIDGTLINDDHSRLVINDKETVEEIKRVLLKYETKRKYFYTPYPRGVGTVELMIVYFNSRGDFKEIVFGDVIFAESDKESYFEIVNAEELKEELKEILKRYEVNQ